MKYRKDSKYFLLNGKLSKTENFPFYLFEKYKSVYEVIKYSSAFLFGEEHQQRLRKSIQIAFPGYQCKYSFELEELKYLFEANQIEEGNVRIDYFPESKTALAFLIPHFYPPAKYYEFGIEAAFQYDERPMQNAKTYNALIREKANSIIAEKGVFETILVDAFGNITEGSRSNIFLVKGNKFYTTPEEIVLPGITRMNMISFLRKNNIPLIIKGIKVSEIDSFDALFFTGTSIGALPCHRVEEVNFDVENPILRRVITDFNLLRD